MGVYSKVRSTLWWLSGYPANEYSHILKMSESWTRRHIEDFRDEKLRKLITHCYQNVDYYRKIMDSSNIKPSDIQHAADLDKLPILTKDVVRSHSQELLARNISEMSVSWVKTGGTTGEPLRVCRNRQCNAWGNMCYERGLRWGGLEVDGSRIRLYGGTLGIDKTRSITMLAQTIRRDLFLPAFELRTDTALSFFDKIRHSKIPFLLGYASAIYQLALFAEELNQKIEFRAVFPTAELLLPEWEMAIRRIFKCAVLPYYGCGEVNSLGYQTLESKAYLIPEEHALIEVMRNDGSCGLSGEGRFLITDLDNYAMPIVRYANGDAGRISGAKEELPFSRIERLDGRYNSFLMTETGDLISGVLGTHAFRHVPSVQSYRIIQEEPLRLVIKVVPRGDFTEAQRDLIEDIFVRHLGRKMKIFIEQVPELELPPSGKAVFVINRCLERTIRPL
jgi:phenylacetate-CoA ligase